MIHGRAYCLVTYGEAMFHDIARRIAALAGPPALTIDNVIPNPDFPMLAEARARFAAAQPAAEVIVALGGGSVIDAAKVVAAGANGFDAVRHYLEAGAGTDAARKYSLSRRSLMRPMR